MKKLLVIFAVLVALATLTALAGILLSDQPLGLGGPRVLTWRLDEPIGDYAAYRDLPLPGYSSRQSLATIYSAMDRARDDDSVEGLAIYIESARFGLATAQELRGLIVSLRERGKFVECYMETAGEGGNGTTAYYLASACDQISLAPPGDLNILGLFADSMFLRGALDKLKIHPDFAHVGQYKSASEVYTESEHSPAAAEALRSLLDDLYGQIVAGVATGRDLEPDRVRSLIDGAPYAAEQALELGLVDRLEYPDEFRTRIEGVAGDSRLVTLEEYRQGLTRPSGPAVAVVFAQGTILRGASGVDPWTDEQYVGSTDFGRLLEELADDDSLEAIVLRIDSPGGSALASDLILRQVERLATRKPLIVSMSDLAASGGYYIAAKADTIVASPATLTGSIGVVGGKLVTGTFQEELLGISHDTMKRGENADIYSPVASFTTAQGEQFERLMRRVYDTFIGHVAEGREMTPEEVDAVAQGRVWSGERALELGLVDELGGLDRAIELAREASGTSGRLSLQFHPRPPGLMDLFSSTRPGLESLDLLTLLRKVADRPLHLLETPPDVVRLSQSLDV